MTYKARYTFGEFWAELTQGTLYKAYARANPGEASKLEELAQKKIDELPYVLPNDLAKTRTGRAIVMVFCTLPGGRV